LATAAPSTRALARTYASATEAQRPFGLLLGDIDHFKDVNDRHGHLVGDQVLIQVADALRGALGDDGEVFRYGGEELVAIVNTADNLDDLVHVAERLRAAVASRAVQVEHDARPLSVTLSLGAARWTPAEALAPEALVHRADVALYASKHGGRDRVTAWSSALSAAPDPR
jgi:diguanylate cyclase (GGDEF)-like protein